MLKIYLKTKKKIGYLYFPYRDGEMECHNFIKELDSEHKINAYIIMLKLHSIKVEVEAFVSTYMAYNSPANDLDEKSIATLFNLSEWMNEGKDDKDYHKILRQIGRRKEEFITLIKSSTEKRNDLTMIYKLIFETIKDEQQQVNKIQ